MNIIPKVSQLSPRVWRILGCNPGIMTLQGTNVYLVGTGAMRTLIDAGQDGFPEYIENLKKLLNDQSAQINNFIITHWHRDHIGALSEINTAILQGKKPSVYKFFRKEDIMNPGEIPLHMNFRELKDNQIFTVDGATMRVVHTPGHTVDHSIVYLEEENAVFSGDCILGEGTAVFEDLHDYMISLKKILDLKPTLIYPAHGPVVEKPIEVIEYYIQHRLEREKQILNFLASSSATEKEPLSPSDIVKQVYKETPEHLHPAAEVNVRHHLQKLVKDKLVFEQGDRFYLLTR